MRRIRRYIRDENGKMHWYSADSEKHAQLEKQRLIEQLKSGDLSNSGVTFKGWYEKWQSIYRANESKPSRSDTRGRLEAYVFPYIGSMPLVKIKPLHIQEIFAHTSDKSFSFNHKLYTTLNQIFSTAIDNGIIVRSPMQGIKKPKGSKGTNRAITEEERSLLLNAVGDDSASMMVMLMLYCGLRPQEVATLSWSDIDLTKERIRIKSALKRDGTVGAPKSSAGNRNVPIPAPLVEYLRTHQGEGLVCRNLHGNRLTKTTLRQLWDRYKRTAGLPQDLHLYSLRHTYCTDLESAGVPINIAKVLMGHESITVTAGIYTHTQEDAIESAIRRVNDKLIMR